MAESPQRRAALVLAGGGARGAYEAGVLSYLFDHVLPRLQPDFAFDVLSGTSVGAIHAAYTAATADAPASARSDRLHHTWSRMRLGDMLNLSAGDLVRVPLRALGLSRQRRPQSGVFGGLVDLAPLERLVREAIPWAQLTKNLAEGRSGALCVSCTEIRTGRVTVFMDGRLADATPWAYDPNARAIRTPVDERHVRASAAIPFFFPSVLIEDRYYVDGGLRMNTPLSPALRLRADRVLVIALKTTPEFDATLPAYAEDVITQPAFLMGKVLDALTLDQLEYELHRVDLVNAMIEQGTRAFGAGYLDAINEAVREQRGVGFRPVRTCVVRPSEDIGRIAADAHRESGGLRALGFLPETILRTALRGVPDDEADLLSYLYFDHHFTRRLLELGREDARAAEDEILALLA